MNEDIKKYPIYKFDSGRIFRIDNIRSTDDYLHRDWQLHHFIRQSIRKNSLDFYKRVEHLQKLILVPKQMNYDLETMGEKRFKEVWNIDKNDMVFNRKKWREGYYDKEANNE